MQSKHKQAVLMGVRESSYVVVRPCKRAWA